MKSLLIFGYGSLMSRESLLATAPTVQDVTPAYIKGFQRDFSLWDDIGWTQTNLDVAGEPFCALDVHISGDSSEIVNGIVFTVSKSDTQSLLEREKGYELASTSAYSWNTGELIGECIVFSGNKYDGTYVENSLAQKRYWDICCLAAKEYGEEFYNTFLNTTSFKKMD